LKYPLIRLKFDHPKHKANFRRGTPPPSYPNGWFRALSSWELKKGEAKYIKINGRHIALFRGEDGIAYALAAFCTHMGANLALGG
jgi:cholesterol 7-dehydrogenase